MPSTAVVRAMVLKVSKCQSINPAPIRWQGSKLEVHNTWIRLGMDITPYGRKHYLTLTDCRPTCFSVSQHLARQDPESFICQLESIFFKKGLPHELIVDNVSASSSKAFMKEWDIQHWWECSINNHLSHQMKPQHVYYLLSA